MSRDRADHSSPWWNQARAALARIFGAVQVRQVGLTELRAAASRAPDDATEWPAPGVGLQEKTWAPVTDTLGWQPPVALQGGPDLNDAVLGCTVGANAVPHLPETSLHGGATPVFAASVQAADLAPRAGGAGSVLPVSVSLAGGEPHALLLGMPVPTVHAPFVVLERAGGGAKGRDRRSGVPAFGPPQIGARLDRITRVPLLRRRRPGEQGAEGAAGLEDAHQALAAASGTAREEITLLAVFPHVPLTLVQQMAVTPDGEWLRLWLRPDLLASGAGWTAVRVTMVLGRQKRTGETLRAILPEARTVGRKH